MIDDATIGARLRIIRKWRQLTLTELAGLSGLSPSFLSMAERGQRIIDRRSHIAALAAALKVSESELVGGPHLSADPLQADPHTAIPALRTALETNTLSESLCERARPLPELVAATNMIESLRAKHDYIGVGSLLPGVLDELHLHATEPADEAAHRLALRTLIDACGYASTTAKHMNYRDLGHLAALRAKEAASLLDDPLHTAKADFTHVLAMPKAGAWDRTLIAAERAANRLEPHVSNATDIQVLGMLSLTAALAAATLNRGDTAQDWLNSAAELAQRVPDTPDSNWQFFSTTNVGVWRVAVSVERGETGGRVLELAKRIDENKLGTVLHRRAALLADVGRGLARDPKTRGQAVTLLRRAESLTPQYIRNSNPVRETIAVMLQQATSAAGGRELRGMAARMGVAH